MMRWRLLVAEATALLLVAKLLVGSLRFGLWRGLLGSLVAAPAGGAAAELDRSLAAAVERATARLPGEAKCLPRAIALHWMMRRRGRAGQLVIAALPGDARGGLDDLHAWVEVGGEILIGNLSKPFRPLARFGY